MKKRWLVVVLITMAGIQNTKAQTASKAIIETKQYSIYADSVVQQNKYTARVISSKEIVSDYRSPVNAFKSADISFKFSINGKDNEMLSGNDHHFVCNATDGQCETPLIKFGTQLKTSATTGENIYLAPDTKLRIRLDLSDVFKAFDKTGYYTAFNGNKIYKDDFKAVYVAGSTTPMIWDFDNLVNHPQLQLHDDDGDHIYETTLELNKKADEKNTQSSWKLTNDISAYPQYQSGFPISDALYNMSLEEMTRAIEPDSTFRTGKEWAGVWTRDISYSIILSMAFLQPRVAMYSLLRKVDSKGRIIQDTGTGGAWPVSSDRMVWAIAAWELYNVTGDKAWLSKAYAIIKKSIDDDRLTIYDKQTGLVKGESSFLDWREQTYPKWMQPADIFESENLGTNAVHYQVNVILAKMAAMMNDKASARTYTEAAAGIKKGINTYLWMPDKKYYGQYLYGRAYKTLSTRSEALGEALSVLFDIAGKEQQQQIVANTPVTDYGISCIYPQIPDIPPYHNNAVWPFVQSFRMWAGAKAGNENAALESIAAIYRPAAMFLTNKENFVAANGDFLGTQINSDNMLWSLSGNLSIVYKVFFGMHFTEEGLVFSPFVPKAFAGARTLKGMIYRNAKLNITMQGFGNHIKSFEVDGKKTSPIIAPSLIGEHDIRIVLDSKEFNNSSVNLVQNYFSLPVPITVLKGDSISWKAIDGAVQYQVNKNGSPWKKTKSLSVAVAEKENAEYSVVALDAQSVPSFASEPLIVKDTRELTVDLTDYAPKADYPYQGYNGKGFVETSATINSNIQLEVVIKEEGDYLVQCNYANGEGPVNTENKCAIRTVLIDKQNAGVWVLPQRGKGEWSNWGHSNYIRTHLTKGTHKIEISLLLQNINMNIEVNRAMISDVRFVKM